MIVKKIISDELRKIDSLYQKANDPDLKNFLSKLALLETCGWIEVSVDEMIKKIAKRKIKNVSFQKMLDKKIDRTYGFEYSDNFIPIISFTFGLINFEKIENKVKKEIGINNFTKFENALSNLKKIRDSYAHTYIASSKISYAPSWIIPQFNEIYTTLRSFEKSIKETI